VGKAGDARRALEEAKRKADYASYITREPLGAWDAKDRKLGPLSVLEVMAWAAADDRTIERALVDCFDSYHWNHESVPSRRNLEESVAFAIKRREITGRSHKKLVSRVAKKIEQRARARGAREESRMFWVDLPEIVRLHRR
jgi:hypothetical protein